MKQLRRNIPIALFTAACGGELAVPGAAVESITATDLGTRIAALASDEFGGRGPSSFGEDRTMEYLEAQFTALGLEPGNGTSFYQDVPLVRSTAAPGAELVIRGSSGTQRYRYRADFVAWTKRVVDAVSLENSDLVFVGYGIVAPEYDWNDYAGLDVRGKTVVILVNDPGFATGDSALFRGNAMTYYGRWTYKFEEAARQGADGALIVHETAPAAYPWEVVENSWTGPQFSLEAADGNMSRVALEGWITLETARAIFQAGGRDYDQLTQRARQRDFAAVPLDVRVSVSLQNQIERSISRNFLALLPGTDHRDEYIIYMGHWDHFGTDPNRGGDQIFNGAKDNATGTAALLEIAEAFQAVGTAPSRSVLFLAVTAEEQGLLGSSHYADNPVVPLAQTVAALNMDALNTIGRMRDVTVVGYGNSALDDYVEYAAADQNRAVRPDPEPEKGYYYRSDHFSFAKRGVPALYLDPGIDHVEHGEAWTMARLDEYTAERYHKPSDEYDPAWDLSGMVDDVAMLFRIGYRLANSRDFPNWREGTEFKATRDAMMAGR
ncbi:MAG TPA: M28 family metallopeptidase [Gemmatimonadales bacterium]